MPSGKRHTIASAVVAVSSFGALFIYSPSAATYCAVGALAGILISPDADLCPNVTYHYVRKYAGLPAWALWTVIWKPYSFLPHRGFISHAPIVSTVIRLLYLWLWIWPVWHYLELPYPVFTVNAGWWLLGLGLADFCHAILDALDARLGGRL